MRRSWLFAPCQCASHTSSFRPRTLVAAELVAQLSTLSTLNSYLIPNPASLPPLSPSPPQSLGRHCLLLDSFIRSRWKPVGRVLTTNWNVTVRVCVSEREREERGETNKRERDRKRERKRERKHVYANEGAYQGLPPLARLHMQTYSCLFSCHGRCVVSIFSIFIYINKYSRERTEAFFFFQSRVTVFPVVKSVARSLFAIFLSPGAPAYPPRGHPPRRLAARGCAPLADSYEQLI